MRQIPPENEAQITLSQVVKSYAQRIKLLEETLGKVLVHADIGYQNKALEDEIKDVLNIAREL